jgi:hypothetical protein
MKVTLIKVNLVKKATNMGSYIWVVSKDLLKALNTKKSRDSPFYPV